LSQNCSACHPLDYSLVNSPFLNRQGWETEVNFKVYGAPIETAAAKIIIDYLAKNYGTGSQISGPDSIGQAPHRGRGPPPSLRHCGVGRRKRPVRGGSIADITARTGHVCFSPLKTDIDPGA
jgi:hypothetical protein